MPASSRIYPLKFKPRYVEKIWGGRKIETVLGKSLPSGKKIGESWEIFDFPPGVVDQSANWVSVEIASGPLAGRTLHEAVGELGPDLYGPVSLLAPHGQFPILVKFLDAREDLSVQVHPDLAYANDNPGAHLKTEAWYVLQSDPGSRLLKGVKNSVDRASFERAIQTGNVEQLINAIPVSPGDCLYLPSGTVHALGAGILVAEVQTPSDTTFRVFDFNRIESATGKPRQLHVQQALACIDFSAQVPEPPAVESPTTLVNSPFFHLQRAHLKPNETAQLRPEKPTILIATEGTFTVRANEIAVPAKPGEVILIPAAARKPHVTAGDAPATYLEVELPA
jgi:mannose-6-phosphate isomerase